MTDGYAISFGEGVELEEGPDGRLVVQSAECRMEFRDPAAGLRRALRLLAGEGATEDELADAVLETGGPDDLARLYYHLQDFHRRRMVAYGIPAEGPRLATLTPLVADYPFTFPDLAPEAAYRLSRFACLRAEGGTAVLESPLSRARVTLHSGLGAALVAELARPLGARALADRLPGLPGAAVSLLLRLLLGAGFVYAHRADAPWPEGTTLAQWDFHDLLFHARSRLGRHANPYGATYRFHGKLDPLPAVKPAMDGETVDLFVPDLDRLEREDPPFSLVLEHRRSIRDYDAQPLTARQLGEFLYRAARTRELTAGEYMELCRRPYPGGGAIHELEVYPVVRSCSGITPGLYHYRSKEHRLVRIGGAEARWERLLKDSQWATGEDAPPQVLLAITARFQRLSWKYEAMAYSAMLKDVGVLMQTMYLVATAMDLAPCALGGGDSDLFARAAGLDWLEETTIGEFLLGSMRTGAPPGPGTGEEP